MSALFKKKDDEDPAGSGEAPSANDADGDAPHAAGSQGTDAGTAPPAGNESNGAGSPREGSIDVESTLKDLAARMSKLSSNIEGMQEDRAHMEGKLSNVEDRLGRLGHLAEAVSSEYNPFVAEKSPEDPTWDDEHPLEEEATETNDLDLTPLTDPEPSDEAVDADAPEPDSLEPPTGELEDLGNLWESTDPDRDVQAPGDTPEGTPEPELNLADAPGPAAPEQAEESFARNILLLEWVGFMLREVGRSGLMDLLEYYQSLGWLDDRTKSRALRVATGVRADGAPTHEDPAGWRGDLELHERSLVALERLQGRESPATQLEEVRLDIQRIFDR